jgi:hypothetical protein
MSLTWTDFPVVATSNYWIPQGIQYEQALSAYIVQYSGGALAPTCKAYFDNNLRNGVLVITRNGNGAVQITQVSQPIP